MTELSGGRLVFSSGSELEFAIELRKEQKGWSVSSFHFHVELAQPRRVQMVRIHLKQANSRDPLSVPRCHLHVDYSRPHVPFPVMNPQLILHFMCEHIEPDIGVAPDA